MVYILHEYKSKPRLNCVYRFFFVFFLFFSFNFCVVVTILFGRKSLRSSNS